MGFRWNKVQVVALGIETGSVGLLKAGLRDYQAGGDTQVHDSGKYRTVRSKGS